MSTLTDEEKAAKFAEGVENEDDSKDEPKDKDEKANKAEDNDQDDSDSSDKSEDESKDKDQIQDSKDKDKEPHFTKKFENLKGDTPEEYAKNLETALDNSTGEFHKLRKQMESDAKIIEQAKKIVADGKADDKGKTDLELDDHPTIKRLQAREQQEINDAFAEFKEDYPQVADIEEFKKFEIAVAHSGNMIRDLEGREPSLKEMFEKAAENLGWNSGDKVAQATKDAGSNSKTNSSTKAKTSSDSKISDAQVKVARNLFPGKSDEQIRKELEQYA